MQKPYTHLQVETESYKSEPKTAKIETETTIQSFGKGNKSQIRGLRSISQGDMQRVSYDTKLLPPGSPVRGLK